MAWSGGSPAAMAVLLAAAAAAAAASLARPRPARPRPPHPPTHPIPHQPPNHPHLPSLQLRHPVPCHLRGPRAQLPARLGAHHRLPLARRARHPPGRRHGRGQHRVAALRLAGGAPDGLGETGWRLWHTGRRRRRSGGSVRNLRSAPLRQNLAPVPTRLLLQAPPHAPPACSWSR